MDPVLFYSCRNQYGCFSNFKIGTIMMDGKPWRSAEHWYQAQKYTGTEHVERIRNLKRAQEAFDEGQLDLKGKRSYADWEKNKRDIMYKVVKAKFSQRLVFRRILLETGDRPIFEHCEDKVWGDGKDGTGKNYLGKILMRVRDELRKEEEKEKEKDQDKEGDTSDEEQVITKKTSETRKNKASQPAESTKKAKKLKTTNKAC
eukprot:Phypoly_transcript_22398.p1 GENE.Phypoly_transcript_22398~~Phypoly_transcript_22398.p1  ORF type:complete len:202 (+),score=32.48 Phypoly_transcript_22398:2-607(+)